MTTTATAEAGTSEAIATASVAHPAAVKPAGAKQRLSAKLVLGTIGSALLRLVYLVPVFGWMVREFVEGPLESKAWFVLCMFLTAVILVFTYGYPALITIALGGVAMGMCIVIGTTLE